MTMETKTILIFSYKTYDPCEEGTQGLTANPIPDILFLGNKQGVRSIGSMMGTQFAESLCMQYA